ncbi:hypothetical protein [Streptomyces sp. NRRL S-455]|uniref:hypothetical protein n=1 Tax=Streptomyces sp. NRRL S-455 TaxID=1463908 RepID=UPI0004C1C5F3|nr:hypothetical protein [Streptomyces sp. NRRL S-455]
MRTRWVAFGLAMLAFGVVSIAAITVLYVSEFHVLPVYSVLGSTSATGLTLGFCVLFYEWRDHR